MQTISRDEHVEVKSWNAELPKAALNQLRNASNMCRVWPWVAAMPGVMTGKGSCKGVVIPMRGALSPGILGGGIGDGTLVVETDLRAASLDTIDREAIECSIWERAQRYEHDTPTEEFLMRHHQWLDMVYVPMVARYPSMTTWEGITKQCGTFGDDGFAMLCEDERGIVWVLVNAGPRRFGEEVINYHSNVARKQCADEDLPTNAFAYLNEGTMEFDSFTYDLGVAEKYAAANREVIAYRVLDALAGYAPFCMGRSFVSPHTTVSEETHYGKRLFVTRRNAIRAGVGDPGIMIGFGKHSAYVVTGLSNAESFKSAGSHLHGYEHVSEMKTLARKEHELSAIAFVNCH